MKKVCVLCFLTAVLFLLAGCAVSYLPRPETDLEFWIAENVDGVDFSGHREKHGIMGGCEYYGSGYAPAIDESGKTTDPEECVIYTVTAFPDYSSEARHITHITITDPKIRLYGVTLRSSADEIKSAMERNGFGLREDPQRPGSLWINGKYSIYFTAQSIVISVDVSNSSGIVF